MRGIIRKSVPMEEFTPQQESGWEENIQRFKKLEIYS
jgi:hypothetical protein